MTLRTLLPLALVVIVPTALVYAVVRLSRWQAGRADNIDALIAKNAATFGKDMARMDWAKADRAGEIRWQETLRAQRKTRRPLSHEIVPFEKRKSR